jgi:hypothetical protein
MGNQEKEENSMVLFQILSLNKNHLSVDEGKNQVIVERKPQSLKRKCLTLSLLRIQIQNQDQLKKKFLGQEVKAHQIKEC